MVEPCLFRVACHCGAARPNCQLHIAIYLNQASGESLGKRSSPSFLQTFLEFNQGGKTHSRTTASIGLNRTYMDWNRRFGSGELIIFSPLSLQRPSYCCMSLSQFMYNLLKSNPQVNKRAGTLLWVIGRKPLGHLPKVNRLYSLSQCQ